MRNVANQWVCSVQLRLATMNVGEQVPSNVLDQRKPGNSMESSAPKKLTRWLIPLVAAFVVGGILTFGVLKVLPSLPPLDAESEIRDTQVINSITRQEQVVLLSLGIQGISEKNEKSKFLGLDIPGSARASFIQYSFNAKLGIEGKDVEVVKTGEADYLVFIPEFIFIGHDDEDFRLIAEKNGVLSGITPKIDAAEVINNILNDEAQDQYINTNRETLEDQAGVFYASIITSIDPTITIRFEFRQRAR